MQASRLNGDNMTNRVNRYRRLIRENVTLAVTYFITMLGFMGYGLTTPHDNLFTVIGIVVTCTLSLVHARNANWYNRRLAEIG